MSRNTHKLFFTSDSRNPQDGNVASLARLFRADQSGKITSMTISDLVLSKFTVTRSMPSSYQPTKQRKPR